MLHLYLHHPCTLAVRLTALMYKDMGIQAG
jgi:hypothetical protein